MFVEDHSAFLIDFGVDAVVDGRIVRGIFDAAYADPLGIAGSMPALLCVETLVAHAAQGDNVTLGGDDYTIAAIQPDGTGMAILKLRAV